MEAPKSNPPWEAFRVGNEVGRTDCLSLTTISHVAHVDTAIAIIRDGLFRPSLICDESILKKRRILVNWLSPKEWGTGSRYGNVEFVFDWPSMIRGMNYYWVEAIAYKVKAPRILVTQQDRDDDARLVIYDPRRGDGPWYYSEKRKKHFWNDNFTLEILLEREIYTDEIEEVRFVDHHSDYCCVKRCCPSACKYLGMSDRMSSSFLVAGVIQSGAKPDGLKFADSQMGISSPAVVKRAWRVILKRLLERVPAPRGTVRARSGAAPHLATAIMSAYYRQDLKAQKELGGLFRSQEDLVETCAAVVEKVFGVKEGSLARELSC